jgi:hypothetical protein
MVIGVLFNVVNVEVEEYSHYQRPTQFGGKVRCPVEQVLDDEHERCNGYDFVGENALVPRSHTPIHRREAYRKVSDYRQVDTESPYCGRIYFHLFFVLALRFKIRYHLRVVLLTTERVWSLRCRGRCGFDLLGLNFLLSNFGRFHRSF